MVLVLAMPSLAADKPARPPAPEFTVGVDWVNVQRPLTFADLRGRVVILDFWTYGCVNCMHVNDELAALERKHGDRLVVVGVHSPKFDNEKNLGTLRRTVVRYGREHPIVNDVDWSMMMSYGVRAWPTLVVVDPAGGVVGYVAGEGHQEVLDRAVTTLLEEQSGTTELAPLPLALEKDRIQGAFLAAPGKLAVSATLVAVSDTLHNRVLIVDHQGRVVRVVGGGDPGLTDGAPEVARFTRPQGLAFGAGRLFVADTGNHTIRAIDLATGEVTTVAGNGTMELRLSGEFDARSVGMRSPWALALDPPWLYVAMAGNHQIWRLNVDTGRLALFAGSGIEGIADGELLAAEFSQPSGLALSGRSLLVADAEDSAVRRIDLDAGRVETLIGKGLFVFGDRDGSFDDALLQHVLGVVAVSADEVIVADTYNHKLKRLDLKARTIETLAGTGQPGRGEGPGAGAQLNEPGGVALLGERVLVADTNNDRIVWFDLGSRQVGEWPLAQ
ncbi:MAG: redoxin domain-containing protein [Ectothiorhodospiraceae bacterium]|nr:redoxin domain-containing protein [Ectothiorhodospiraceae bacterium]